MVKKESSLRNLMTTTKREPSLRNLMTTKKESSLRNLVSNIGTGINNKREQLRELRKQGSIKNMVANMQNNKKVRATIQTCQLHPNPDYEELGCLHFKYAGDSMEQAMAEAIATDRPIMIVFQELPGCRTCLKFGQDVLSHPLIVEAAETLFVPIVVNNRGITPGDSSVLDFYREPRLNNPVVRFVSGKTGKDISARVSDGNWTVGALAKSMVEALEPKVQEKNLYLDLLSKEESARDRKKEATFAMSCFWVGEVEFADLNGVLGTKAGWIGNHEVVRVTYDPEIISYANLVKAAIEKDIASTIFCETDAERTEAEETMAAVAATATHQSQSSSLVQQLQQNDVFRGDGDPKHALRGTTLRYVPLTALQAAKANRCISRGEALESLSPRQLVLFRAYTDKWMNNKTIDMEETVDVPIMEAWTTVK
eukprot:CAMPEP_0118687526 /NCGR_PEP_ID=MMETSP0800-20121206/8429_1 /TAXON_ID=210618 ORGANISM="Striatella unipunctata, Strain CCMP2910" /NCGR_SAMPLE_ID=MMETSP0800 /ASSEMBLY_ACC=CAM_ASM_000638 /LENGTH=424 /DNA_ID=CAMNT_0006584715 /DNA_START=30 /DNA_END=1304 /DNA_ORIENTATION=+